MENGFKVTWLGDNGDVSFYFRDNEDLTRWLNEIYDDGQEQYILRIESVSDVELQEGLKPLPV